MPTITTGLTRYRIEMITLTMTLVKLKSNIRKFMSRKWGSTKSSRWFYSKTNLITLSPLKTKTQQIGIKSTLKLECRGLSCARLSADNLSSLWDGSTLFLAQILILLIVLTRLWTSMTSILKLQGKSKSFSKRSLSTRQHFKNASRWPLEDSLMRFICWASLLINGYN